MGYSDSLISKASQLCLSARNRPDASHDGCYDGPIGPKLGADSRGVRELPLGTEILDTVPMTAAVLLRVRLSVEGPVGVDLDWLVAVREDTFLLLVVRHGRDSTASRRTYVKVDSTLRGQVRMIQ